MGENLSQPLHDSRQQRISDCLEADVSCRIASPRCEWQSGQLLLDSENEMSTAGRPLRNIKVRTQQVRAIPHELEPHARRSIGLLQAHSVIQDFQSYRGSLEILERALFLSLNKALVTMTVD
jgi:hypothetical protein